jgi:hypothetical protein
MCILAGLLSVGKLDAALGHVLRQRRDITKPAG